MLIAVDSFVVFRGLYLVIVTPLAEESYSKQKGSGSNGRRRRRFLRVATMSHLLERHTIFLVKAF